MVLFHTADQAAAAVDFDAAEVDPEGLRITVKKAIPAQAGMAGGSSDAAAVLRALNRHYGRFSDEQLRAVGLDVGSDVPYCLFGGVALAKGRGEILTRLPDLPEKLFFVLVKPKFSVSTPALFRQIDAAGVRVRPDTAAMLRALASGDRAGIGKLLCNAFQPEVAADFPVVEEIRAAMLEHGAFGAQLTGTGSVVFGLFGSKLKAAAAALVLESRFPAVWLTAAV